MKAIFKLLNPDNTMSINRQLAHAVGLAEAVVYGALLSKYAYYSQRGLLTDGDWFYSTAEDLEESTALTARQQRRCIDTLTKLGLIRCKVQGMPAKRFFYINDNAELLAGILSNGSKPTNDSKPSFDKSAQLHESSAQSEMASDGLIQQDKSDDDSAPVLTKAHNLFYPNVTTCFTESEKQVVTEQQSSSLYKTKEIKLKSINQADGIDVGTEERLNLESCDSELKFKVEQQIQTEAISSKYGVCFGAFVENIVIAGLQGKLTCRVYEKIVSGNEILAAYKNIGYNTICRVADYISEKRDKIRFLRQYLIAALYATAREERQIPRLTPHTSINMEDVMERLRQHYG
ncbi:MAG TPA: hypothetical protein DER68_00995 [Ruminococcaceae bacterium]|nr:hypothetical protein [Oscillospiraceae bacterium]